MKNTDQNLYVEVIFMAILYVPLSDDRHPHLLKSIEIMVD